MSDYSLAETGELDYEFEGKLLAQSDSHWVNGVEKNRWHEIDIYQDDSDPEIYIVHVSYETCWQGENSIYRVYICTKKDQIKEVLDSHDPVADLAGFPSGDRFVEKQKALIKELTFNYREIKVEILKELGFKRKINPETRGRKSLGDSPRVSTTVTLDAILKNKAIAQGINLSEILNNALKEILLRSDTEKAEP